MAEEAGGGLLGFLRRWLQSARTRRINIWSRFGVHQRLDATMK